MFPQWVREVPVRINRGLCLGIGLMQLKHASLEGLQSASQMIEDAISASIQC